MTAILERFTPAAHFYPGDISGIRTALVLACPGRFEESEQRPVANTSGRNLDRLLAVLNAVMPKEFTSARRYDYVITNSTWNVYKGVPRPTVAHLRESFQKNGKAVARSA